MILSLLSIRFIRSNIQTPFHGLYEPVENSQNIRERKAVRYQSNLFLQDEEKLPYATYYLEYLKMLDYFKHITNGAYQQCILKF